jgi:hypothetical protein
MRPSSQEQRIAAARERQIRMMPCDPKINRWTNEPHLHLRERARNGYYLNKKGTFSKVRKSKAV